MNTNRRLCSRIAFDAPCLLHQGDRHWYCEVLDISLSGLLLRIPEDFNGITEAPFKGTVMLTQQGPNIVMQLELRHQEEGQLGFYSPIKDLESVSHLRRLVELNLGDDQMLQRELGTLINQNG